MTSRDDCKPRADKSSPSDQDAETRTDITHDLPSSDCNAPNSPALQSKKPFQNLAQPHTTHHRWTINPLLITLTDLCNTSSSLMHLSCRSVSYRTSLPTVYQSSRFDLLLPQPQNRLHGRIHSQALICTTLDCLQRAQNHCCGGVRATVSSTNFGYESREM